MSEQFRTILISVLIILVVIAAWVTAIVFIYRDTAQRKLSGWQQFIWRVLALFPVVGLVAYLIARQLAVPVTGTPAGPRGRSLKRVTLLKPAPSGAPKRLPTIPAAEYLRAARLGQRGGPPQSAQDRMTEADKKLACTLAVVEGPYEGQEFVVNHLPASIGRGPGCTIRLDNDRGVSRRHAELYRRAGLLRIRDLSSTHGTHVNGSPINDQGLNPGDKIRVGYSLLVVTSSR